MVGPRIGDAGAPKQLVAHALIARGIDHDALDRDLVPFALGLKPDLAAGGRLSQIDVLPLLVAIGRISNLDILQGGLVVNT
jgi:hypothetical protein